MNKVKLILLIFFAFFSAQSCNQQKTEGSASDTTDSGTAKFVADESYQPILDQELDIFKKLNRKAHPVMVYKPENDALRLLLNDSVRLAILARDLTPDERKVFEGNNITPLVNRIAIDAVTLIVNQVSNDTLISVGQLKQMLNGQSNNQKKLVFDNANSSLYRYLKQLSGVNDIKQKNIYALKNNREVLEYIAKNQDAIGVIGLSWLGDPDADYSAAVDKVKVMSVKDESSKKYPNQYFLPSQNTLMLKQYPLSRDLYVINCTGKMGLGRSFAGFLLGEKGQRFIMMSNMVPDSIPERQIEIKHTY
jgi:phosphate transport system substrate-binding protein